MTLSFRYYSTHKKLDLVLVQMITFNLTIYTSDPRCKTNIDECESSPCQYGGTCVDGIARYECVCIPGITGPNCETDIDECQSMPCQNGGMCIDHING